MPVVVTIRDKQWTVSVASTPTELLAGLSGVASIAEWTGMIFDMGIDQKRMGINMQEMLFPLDIIFIGATTGVRGVMRNVQPGEEGVTFIAETTPGARYFLEVNAGEAEGIEVGDSINIQGDTLPSDVSPIVQGLIATVVVVGLIAALMPKKVKGE